MSVKTPESASFFYMEDAPEDMAKHGPKRLPSCTGVNKHHFQTHLEHARIIIVDLDGTICDVGHRLHHLKEQDFDTFNSKCDQDPAYSDILNMVFCLGDIYTNDREHDCIFWFLTAREDPHKEKTIVWLHQNFSFGMQDGQYWMLSMRKLGDRRHDFETKEDLFDRRMDMLGIKPEQIMLAIDDRPHVNEMWNKRGIKTLTVNNLEKQYNAE